MKKKILILAIIMALVCTLAFALSSCGKSATVNPGTPISVDYLRITGFDESSVTFNFNAPYASCDFDVRFSAEEITEENFDAAEEAKFKVEGDGVGKVLTLKKKTVSLESKYYVAIKPYVENHNGDWISLDDSITLGDAKYEIAICWSSVFVQVVNP